MPTMHIRSVLFVRVSAALAALALAAAPSAAASTVPAVSVGTASAITTTGATVSATVNPEGSSTSYWVKYWHGTQSWTTAKFAAGSGTTPVPVSASLSGLLDGTQYYFRVIASNALGTTAGTWAIFTTAMPVWNTEAHPQTTWAPGNTPLTDAQAAALVTPEPELRPANTTANDYVPTSTQLSAFYAATPKYLNDPLRAYVTGRPGIPNPTTDELIQWAAHKWGIPEDVVRAEMVVESDWKQSGMGDYNPVSSSWYVLYPVFSRTPNTLYVYQSLGVMQVKWMADNSGIGAGTEPLRWESTAFNLDFYASTVRWMYDGYSASLSWMPNIYTGNGWNSIGGWYGCGGCTAAQNYITWVQNALAGKYWAQPGF